MEGNKRKNIIPLGVTIGGFDFTPPGVKDAFSTTEGVVDTVIFVLNSFVGLSALVAVIMIIVSGYLFITSAGDADKIQKAQGTITAAVVGLVIVFLARTLIVFLIENILQ